MKRSLSVLLVLGLLTSCESQDGDPPPGAARAASGANSGTLEEAPRPPGAPASPALSPADAKAATQAIAELKAEARKLLAADKAVIANRHGYEQSVAKHLRVMEETGMDLRIPDSSLDAEALEKELAVYAGPLGLSVVQLRLGAAKAPAPLPQRHTKSGPFPYEIDQLFERRPLRLTLRPQDLDALRTFWTNLPRRDAPMLDLPTLLLEDEGATFTGFAYSRRAVKPPIHEPRTPTLEELAARASVPIPPGHPRLAEVEGLLAEHRSLSDEIAASLEVLGRSHLMGSWFRFYRGRAKEIEGRAFPTPVDQKSGGSP